jgi:hypothetical protein
MTDSRRNTLLFFAALFGAMLALRLCHAHVLWADEDYHLAAGLQVLHGKMLYRDLWYDKPPLAAWLYAAMGALPGWPLRLFDAAWLLGICAATWRFARDLWGRREAFLAAGLMAFFLNFDFPSAVIPAAPDLLLMLPHIVAVHCAWKRRPFWSGICCGIGFLFHTKAVFVLAACAVVAWPALPLLLAGFAIPNAAALTLLGLTGALPEYVQQVWRWGFVYAGSSPEPQPALNALRRILDWSGFHAALVLGAVLFGWRQRTSERFRMAAWLAAAFAGVALGGRFFPRYFLLVLPPLVLMSCRPPFFPGVAPHWWRGLWSSSRPPSLEQSADNSVRREPSEPQPDRAGPGRMKDWSVVVAAAAALALLVPLVRFAPRYFKLAVHPDAPWADIALDRDSQTAAALVNARKRPGDTLFVWGYRPGLYVYTRMPVASAYWDSQPITGVPADRHLRDAVPLVPEWAARNRLELARTHPAFIVDSLSLANPRLSLEAYPDLRAWLAGYSLVARTPLSLIYRNSASAPR